MALTPLQTEAYALHQGLCEAVNKGFSYVQINSDCTKLVRAIDSHQQPFKISTVVSNIKVLRSKFSICEIRKVSRVEVAPALALVTAAKLGNLVC